MKTRDFLRCEKKKLFRHSNLNSSNFRDFFRWTALILNKKNVAYTVPSSPPCPGPACWCTAPSRGVSASWWPADSGTGLCTPLEGHTENTFTDVRMLIRSSIVLTKYFTQPKLYFYCYYYYCLTNSVCLSRQLDAAVLQLLHPLLQVCLLLHEGGESLLKLLHGSLQGLMNFHWYSSFWKEESKV